MLIAVRGTGFLYARRRAKLGREGSGITYILHDLGREHRPERNITCM